MPTVSSSRCLVIGGGGNLGSHIVRLLIERGALSVDSFDVRPYEGADASKVLSIVGDITDYESVLHAMKKGEYEVVFHTASIIDIRPSPSLRMQRVNVDGTYNIVAACKAANVSSLVYTSSLEVVAGVMEDGVARKLNDVDENLQMPARHQLPYGATKAMAERIVLAAHSPSLRTCAMRIGYIGGAGAIGLRMEMIRAHQRADRYVTARVPATLSTVHPRNAAHAHLLAVEKIHDDDVGGQPFFIKDFEANVVEMALDAFQNTRIKPTLLPLPLAYSIAYLLHLLDLLLHAWAGLWGRTHDTSAEVLDIRAVNMAYIDIIVSAERARSVLGYQPLVTRADTFKEARVWAEAFYKGLDLA